MARIAGVDLPPRKRAEIGLAYIFGVGRTRAKSILHRVGVDEPGLGLEQVRPRLAEIGGVDAREPGDLGVLVL